MYVGVRTQMSSLEQSDATVLVGLVVMVCEQVLSLMKLLDALGQKTMALHNAGNDAYYTVCALLLMCAQPSFTFACYLCHLG